MKQNKLIALAWKAAEKAYAPYSGWQVGAAVLGEDGHIYLGCNIENASYGLTNCAERTAIFKMVSEGCRHFLAIAVVSGETCNGYPCGACRQVMSEFAAKPDVPVYIAGRDGSCLVTTVAELLPYAFEKDTLLGEEEKTDE